MTAVDHPFRPDPLTPTACVVCALHPAWHPEHQPPEATKEIEIEELFRQALRDDE